MSSLVISLDVATERAEERGENQRSWTAPLPVLRLPRAIAAKLLPRQRYRGADLAVAVVVGDVGVVVRTRVFRQAVPDLGGQREAVALDAEFGKKAVPAPRKHVGAAVRLMDEAGAQQVPAEAAAEVDGGLVADEKLRACSWCRGTPATRRRCTTATGSVACRQPRRPSAGQSVAHRRDLKLNWNFASVLLSGDSVARRPDC